MDSAQRHEIVAKLDGAFGGAEDVSPTATHDLHVLLTDLELSPPWQPSPTRALVIFRNWPHEKPKFFIDPSVVGETGQPPRSNSDAYHLDQAWRAFSWNVRWSGDDPVRAIQLWLNRFVDERT